MENIENILFFWLSWILWIVIYFFEGNQKIRYRNAVAVLLLMIASTWYVKVQEFQLLVPMFLNAFIGMYYLALEKQKGTLLFLTISLTFGYSGLQLWQDLNPLWLFFSTTFISVIVGYIILMVFAANNTQRIAIWLICTSFGQLLYGVVKHSYGLTVPIGNFQYLMDTVLLIMIFTILSIVKRLGEKIEQTVKNVRIKMKT
ncbi:hypothetical protein HNQ94_000638 [Salirhabdus euzebyi]|uniref:Uncharacterized protein n=1 Tax=Salirhabdus euzebyi TaxID=394506 RepID=A0A841Q1L9_9BACI|nr:hypothetical protein [Salirhabdus euzebyi]MBB6452193.1 hypothetical protein [Salirhabdus euzebyi]